MKTKASRQEILELVKDYKLSGKTDEQLKKMSEKELKKILEPVNEQSLIVHDARKSIYEILQREKTLRAVSVPQKGGTSISKPSPEVSQAIVCLTEAFMYLGKSLTHLGVPNPYKEAQNPEDRLIKPMDLRGRGAVVLVDKEHFQSFGYIGKVKSVRVDIDKMERFYSELMQISCDNIIKSHDRLAMSKNWLGWELKRIYDES